MDNTVRPGVVGKGLARTRALVILAVLTALGRALWQVGCL